LFDLLLNTLRWLFQPSENRPKTIVGVEASDGRIYKISFATGGLAHGLAGGVGEEVAC